MTAIDDLYQAGTSTWLDDLSRERIATGNLAEVKDCLLYTSPSPRD